MMRYTIFALVLVAVTSVHGATRDRREVVLNGRGVSAGQQCRERNYDAACRAVDLSERCTQLKCTYINNRGDIPTYDTYDLGPAKQGTSCGDNKICIAGKCVDDLSNFKSSPVTEEEEYDCDEVEDYEIEE